MSGGNGRQAPNVLAGKSVANSPSQKPGAPPQQFVSEQTSNTTSIATKKRRLLDQQDWTGLAVQKPLLINYPKPSKKLRESHTSHNIRKVSGHGMTMANLGSQPDNIRVQSQNANSLRNFKSSQDHTSIGSSSSARKENMGKSLLSNGSVSQLSRPHCIDAKLATTSSSLSNHSSCTQSLRHMLWSDQSCSTNSSLPRFGTSPRTIIHPQPVRGMRSGLLQLRSPSPEQLESLMGQQGSQTTMDETDNVPTQPTSMHSTSCNNSCLSYMSCEALSSPKRNKSHDYGNSRSETSCLPRISQDPAASSTSYSSSSPSLCITYHRQRLPDLTHASLDNAPADPPPGPSVTEAGAYGDNILAIMRGSTTRHSPPASDTNTDADHIKNDASLSVSSEMPSAIDPQELLDFLHEFEQDRQRSKKAVTTGLGPQSSTTHCDNHSNHCRLTDGTEGQSHRKCLGGSMASDMAQPQPPSPSSQKYPTKRITSPDDLLQQTPALSASDSIPSLFVHAPDSPPAMPKIESRYRPPELFIGRLAASGPQTRPQGSNDRRKGTNRPDIRALPNYNDDPIDEGM
ncbi:hypothetical protein E4U21_003770 [Claviceps maximensis]|nr:hypothetical protein E4U21_003770 [Claviceps maximensis]